jgi:hypothetical protein
LKKLFSKNLTKAIKIIRIFNNASSSVPACRYDPKPTY